MGILEILIGVYVVSALFMMVVLRTVFAPPNLETLEKFKHSDTLKTVRKYQNNWLWFAFFASITLFLGALHALVTALFATYAIAMAFTIEVFKKEWL